MHRARLLRVAVVSVLGLLAPAAVQADLFDTARRAVRTDLGRADLSGVTVRGGAGLTTGQSPTSVTLLRGQGQFGGPCGSFDFAGSLTDAFQEIPTLMEGLIQQLVSNMPMLVLCYTSPTLCDLSKHFQALVNAVIQARFAQCQAIQNAMAYGGLRLRGGQISQCLEDEVSAGRSINEALKTCNGTVTSIRSPNGTRGPQVALVQETLDAAGASPEMQTLAKNLLGEVTLRVNHGQLGTQQDRPQAHVLARYEQHRQEMEAAVRAAMQELQSTGTIADATLQAASVPGQPLPRAALEALVSLQHDPVRFNSLLTKLTTGLAVVHLTWECQELQEQLAGSIEANQELTDEQKRLLEKRLQGLQRDLQQVLQKKEVLEKHLQPALDALLNEYNAVQDVATRAGVPAPPRQAPAVPYRQQLPGGYAQ